MTKKDMVEKIASDAEITKKQADAAYESFLKLIADTINEEGKFSLNGIGNFKVITTKPRTGRNPATGATMEIPAKRKVKFAESSKLLK